MQGDILIAPQCPLPHIRLHAPRRLARLPKEADSGPDRASRRLDLAVITAVVFARSQMEQRVAAVTTAAITAAARTVDQVALVPTPVLAVLAVLVLALRAVADIPVAVALLEAAEAGKALQDQSSA
jgi:hypothetical protein